MTPKTKVCQTKNILKKSLRVKPRFREPIQPNPHSACVIAHNQNDYVKNIIFTMRIYACHAKSLGIVLLIHQISWCNEFSSASCISKF